jgi:hypothetical protein
VPQKKNKKFERCGRLFTLIATLSLFIVLSAASGLPYQRMPPAIVLFSISRSIESYHQKYFCSLSLFLKHKVGDSREGLYLSGGGEGNQSYRPIHCGRVIDFRAHGATSTNAAF